MEREQTHHTWKIAAALIISGGLVLSGVAAPAMAATGPAKKHAQEVKTVYNEFATEYTKEAKALAKKKPKLNAQICTNFTEGGSNDKGQDVAEIQALVAWNNKGIDLAVGGTPWRKIVNKKHFVAPYKEILKWRCSGPGGTPRTFK